MSDWTVKEVWERQQQKNKHTYDEHGLCFECDKPQPMTNAERQKQDRERKKARGLVRFVAWVTPKEKEQLRAHLDQLRKMGIVK